MSNTKITQYANGMDITFDSEPGGPKPPYLTVAHLVEMLNRLVKAGTLRVDAPLVVSNDAEGNRHASLQAVYVTPMVQIDWEWEPVQTREQCLKDMEGTLQGQDLTDFCDEYHEELPPDAAAALCFYPM